MEALPVVLLSMAISGFFIWYFYKKAIQPIPVDIFEEKEE
jgi:hypothetical protein